MMPEKRRIMRIECSYAAEYPWTGPELVQRILADYHERFGCAPQRVCLNSLWATQLHAAYPKGTVTMGQQDILLLLRLPGREKRTDNPFLLWCDDLPIPIDPWSYEADGGYICADTGDILLDCDDEDTGRLVAAAPTLYRLLELLLTRIEQQDRLSADPVVALAQRAIDSLRTSWAGEGDAKEACV